MQRQSKSRRQEALQQYQAMITNFLARQIVAHPTDFSVKSPLPGGLSAARPAWRCIQSLLSLLRKPQDHEQQLPLSRPSATLSPALGGGEGRERGRFMESLHSLPRMHRDYEPVRAYSSRRDSALTFFQYERTHVRCYKFLESLRGSRSAHGNFELSTLERSLHAAADRGESIQQPEGCVPRVGFLERGGCARWGELIRKLSLSALALSLPLAGLAEDARPVSYYHDVVPLLKRSCTGCHHPGKLKGDLDLTSYAAFQKGGKHGAAFAPGKPAESRIIEEVSGEEPNMPKEGDPLSKEEVAQLERWIKEGAPDDTPPEANSFKLSAPPVYSALPVISSIAFSPDASVLAVSGYHEVVLHKSDGSGILARLVGESPRVESIAFSPDGKLLAISGGAQARFGEIQIWDAESHQQLHSYKVANDSLFGVSFSPDGERVAFGCADKTVRLIAVNDGKELMKFDNHSDWVLATAFTVDGKRLLSGSRDRAMKLINVANGQFIDDINKLLENVLCMARHPKEDIVAYGGDLGTPRIYRIAENQGRTAANNDVNMIREFERQPGPVCSIAYGPDGNSIAVGNVNGEVRIYKTSDGSKIATLKENQGAVFALKFHPTKNQLVTGGYDGKVRLFELPEGKLVIAFSPVPIQEGAKVAAVAGDSTK